MLSRFKNWLAKRRQPTLFVAMAVLLVANILIPDPLPFVDEVIMLIATTLLGRWRGRQQDSEAFDS